MCLGVKVRAGFFRQVKELNPVPYKSTCNNLSDFLHCQNAIFVLFILLVVLQKGEANKEVKALLLSVRKGTSQVGNKSPDES